MSDEIITLNQRPKILDSEITVTSEAVDIIYHIIRGESAEGVVFTVRGGGCSGYIYDLELIEKDNAPPAEADVKEFYYSNPENNPNKSQSKPVKIYIPYQVVPLIRGTEIWYEDKLVGGGIKFKNPNANRVCGCGESFS